MIKFIDLIIRQCMMLFLVWKASNLTLFFFSVLMWAVPLLQLYPQIAQLALNKSLLHIICTPYTHASVYIFMIILHLHRFRVHIPSSISWFEKKKSTGFGAFDYQTDRRNLYGTCLLIYWSLTTLLPKVVLDLLSSFVMSAS